MLSASAGDNVGIVAVQFKLDGVNLGAVGNATTSAELLVTVANDLTRP